MPKTPKPPLNTETPTDQTASLLAQTKEPKQPARPRKPPRKHVRTGRKIGRPTSWKEEFIEDAEKYAALGLPMKDMAFMWGVSLTTIETWINTRPPFREALKKGESQKKSRLLAAMMQAAMRGAQAVQIFLAKNWLGMKDYQDD